MYLKIHAYGRRESCVSRYHLVCVVRTKRLASMLKRSQTWAFLADFERFLSLFSPVSGFHPAYPCAVSIRMLLLTLLAGRTKSNHDKIVFLAFILGLEVKSVVAAARLVESFDRFA